MVCPNCANQAPDNAVRCEVCGYPLNANIRPVRPRYIQEQQNHQVIQNNQILQQQQQINQLNQYIQYQQQQINQMQSDSGKILFISGLVVGILSGVLILLSPFLPYITAEAYGFSNSFTLNDISNYYIFVVIALCVGLVIDSIFRHGISNIAVGLIIFGVSIYRYNVYLDFCAENDLSGIAHLSIGYYMIIISAICAIASGILLVVYNHDTN